VLSLLARRRAKDNGGSETLHNWHHHPQSLAEPPSPTIRQWALLHMPCSVPCRSCRNCHLLSKCGCPVAHIAACSCSVHKMVACTTQLHIAVGVGLTMLPCAALSRSPHVSASTRHLGLQAQGAQASAHVQSEAIAHKFPAAVQVCGMHDCRVIHCLGCQQGPAGLCQRHVLCGS
jgi:hypothetical protein